MSKYDEDFEVFWAKFRGRYNPDKGAYGGFVKVGKFLAQQEWRRMAEYEKKHATAVAHKVSGKYVPDANRWLKRKLFDDFEVKDKN